MGHSQHTQNIHFKLSKLYATWEIANILKISISIKLLVKMKIMCFYYRKKTIQTFWPTQ